MAITHSVTISYSDGAINISKTETFGGASAEGVGADLSVTAAVTNILVPFTVTRAKLQCIEMVCDTTSTIKTNTTTGVDTFNLIPNEPVFWSVKSNLNAVTVNNIFTAEVTAMYYTQAAATTGSLNIRSIQNIT